MNQAYAEVGSREPWGKEKQAGGWWDQQDSKDRAITIINSILLTAV